jgi:hypothetical protein
MGKKLSATLILGAAVVWAQSDSTFLYSECSDASRITRVIQSGDAVEVRHSLSGGSETCYAVSVTAAGGEHFEGFLLGAAHPAVIRFERQEESYIAQAFGSAASKKPNASRPAARPKRASRSSWNPFSTK